jgi:hypothetical protein
MRKKRISLIKRGGDQCVSEIRTNENRDKSHEEVGKRSVCK